MQPVFVGRHERQVDQKGRLALPATYRPRFETGCYLAFGQEGCINVFTPEEFEQMAEETMERVRQGVTTRAELRTLASSAFLVQLDGQGRVGLEPALRSFAGIEAGTTVVVTGAFDRVEVWQPQRFADQEAQGTAAIGAT